MNLNPSKCRGSSFTTEPKEKHVIVKPLSSPQLLLKIKTLKHMLLNSYGSNEKLQLFANKQNDDLQIGSSSMLLLKSLNRDLNDPILNIIVTSLIEHLKVHHDFGLYGVYLSLSLVEKGLETNVANCLVSECYQTILKEVITHIKDEKSNNFVKFIDIETVKPVIELLNSVIATKSVFQLNKKSIEKLSVTLLKAYLQNMTSQEVGCKMWPMIQYIESFHFDHLKMKDGLILDLNHYSKSCLDDIVLSLPELQGQKLNVLVLNISLTVGDMKKTLHLIDNQGSKLDIMAFFNTFVDTALKNNIQVVFNQKVIDEEIKKKFADNKILVFDRIGIKAMPYLLNVTEAFKVCNISDLLNIKSCQGFVDEISTLNVNSKSFLFVKNSSVLTSSIIVPYFHDSMQQDMKQICLSCFNTIEKTFKDQKVFLGGGKMEIYLIQFLKDFYKNNFNNVKLPIGTFSKCLDNFCASLNILGEQCTQNRKEEEDIHDCFSSKLNALIVSVQTACLVLQINYQIQD